MPGRHRGARACGMRCRARATASGGFSSSSPSNSTAMTAIKPPAAKCCSTLRSSGPEGNRATGTAPAGIAAVGPWSAATCGKTP